MTRGNVTRWSLAFFSAVVVGGCQCGEKELQCDDISVDFTTPTEGEAVVSPFDVEIRAKDPNGVAVKFDSATLASGAVVVDGTVTDGTAVFRGVQLDGGAHELTASIARGTCNRSAAISVTVPVETCSTPSVTAVTFPQDLDNNGVLNAAELPEGTSLRVRVAAECTQGVEVQIKRANEVVGGPATFSNGSVEVPLPTLPETQVNSGTYELFAELKKGGTAVNSPTTPGSVGSIRIERGPPLCQNTTLTPQGPNGAAGADHKLLVTGSVGPNVNKATFGVKGLGTPVEAVPAQGAVSTTFSVPKTGDIAYEVELNCADSFGNTAVSTKTVRVDYEPPLVAIVSPARADGGNLVVTHSPTPLVLNIAGAENGTTACVYDTSSSSPTEMGCALVQTGVASIDLSFGADGLVPIEVRVSDAAGNEAKATAVMEALLTGCGMDFLVPASCPALISSAQAPDGGFTFRTQSKTTCSNQPVRLSLLAAQADGGAPVETLVASGTVGSSGAAAISATLSSGDFTYRASIDDLDSDGGVSSATCAVTVDLAGPIITSPVVPSGQSKAVIGASQDTQPSSPGAQRALSFTARVPAGGRVDLCTTQAVDPVTSATRGTTTECGNGYYRLAASVVSPSSAFTFPEGDYSIKVVVIGGGSFLASPPVALSVDVTRPCLKASSKQLPQDLNSDARLGTAELAGTAPQLQFELDPGCKDVDLGTLAAAPVVVREIVSGAPVGGFALPADVTFASGVFSVRLTQSVAAEKDYVFFVELTDATGNKSQYSGAADPALFPVRIDTVAPSCTLVTPSASDTLLGQASVPDGGLGVTVGTSTDVATNGVSVALTGPSTQTLVGTPSGPAQQATVTFPVTGTRVWTVTPTCTDATGNSTLGTARTLTVDLDAPRCQIVVPSNAVQYGSQQIATIVAVTLADGGVDPGSAGRLVTCASDGSPLSPALAVDGGVASGQLSYSSGSQTVSCSMSDLAGNSCSASTSGVIVNSTACNLTLTSTVTTSSGFWHNRTNTTGISGSSGTATVTANSPCGAGKAVTLVRVAPSAGTPVSANTDSSGNVSFSAVTLTDGETWTVTIDNSAGVLTSKTFRVALLAPTASGVTINAAPITSGTNLRFVAATGNALAGSPNFFPDLDVNAAGAQFDLTVSNVTNTRPFALDGVLQLVFNGAVVSSKTINADGQNWSFTGASGGTLSHNTVGTFEVRLVDASGNQTAVRTNQAAIDVKAPCLTAASKKLPQDANLDARLNSAELGVAAPKLEFSLDAACDDSDLTTLAPTPVVVREIVSGAPTGTFALSSDVTFASSAFTANLTQGVANEKDYAFFVEVTDSIGNRSQYSGPSDLGVFSVRIDKVAPGCTIVSPSASDTLFGMTQLPDGGLPVTVGTAADVSTNGVAVTLTGPTAQTQQLTPSGGGNQASGTFPVPGKNAWTVASVCTDLSGNATTATARNLTIDLDPPLCQIVAPTSAAPYGSLSIVTTVNVTLNDGGVDTDMSGRFVNCLMNATPLSAMAVSGTQATGTLTYANGTHTVSCSSTDPAGNSCSTSVSGVVVNSTACSFNLTSTANTSSGSWHNLANTTDMGGGVRAATVTANTPDCGAGKNVTLVRTAPTAGSPLSAVTNSSGDVTLASTTVEHGETWAVSIDNGAGVITTKTFRVALLTPSATQVTVNTSAITGGNTLRFVAATGNVNVGLSTPNYFADGNAGLSGAQFDVGVSTVTQARPFGLDGTIQLVFNASVIDSKAMTSDGQSFSFSGATVGHPATGTFEVRVVDTAGNQTALITNPAVVDVVAPCLVAGSKTLPQDANSDARLNTAELGGAAPRLRFNLDATCDDTGLSSLAAAPVAVKEIVSGAPTGSFVAAPGDVTFAAPTFTADLTQSVLSEKDYVFFVQLTDALGNASQYSGPADVARFPVRIDTVAPSCAISTPSVSDTLLGQAQVPGGNFGVTVSTGADVSTNGISVSISGGGNQTQQLTPSSNQASTTFPVTGTHAWTVAATCTDASGNPTTATARNLTIDLDSPVCTITAPSNATPYGVFDLLTTVTVTLPDAGVDADMNGRSVNCLMDATPLSALTVSGSSASGTRTYTNGSHTVSCSATDPAGNSCSPSVSGVVVNTIPCAFALTSTESVTSIDWHNRSNTSGISGSTGTATVTANTSDCGVGKTVTLVRTSPTASTPATAVTDSSGNVSFAGVSLTDAERWDVKIDNGAGVLTTKEFRVALLAPAAVQVSINTVAVTTGTNLYFVASTGNRNAELSTSGYFADSNAGTSGAQFDLDVATVTNTRPFGLDGTVQLRYAGSTIDSKTVTSDSQSFSFVAQTLAHDTTGTLAVRLVNAAGNSTDVISNSAAVDVIVPGAPSVTQNLTDARKAEITLQWSPTYDDSTSGTAPHAGYDVRWTTSSVPGNNALATSTDYFASTSKTETIIAWAGSDSTKVLPVSPLNTVYAKVRAVDEVGNYSAFGSAPTGISNFWSGTSAAGSIVLTGDAGTSFGQHIALGSINNDALTDIVVAAPNRSTNIGSVYVYFGSASLASQAACSAPACQEIQPPDGQSGLFGTDVSTAGNVGDVSGEGKNDLLIAQPTWSASAGRAFLFFGNGSAATIDTATYIEFRGVAGYSYASGARIIRSIDGDALDEIIISAHSYSSNQGRMFIFKGRSVTDWLALQTANGGTVPPTAADWILNGPTPVATNGNQFGRLRNGIQSLGDLNGDGRPEFSIPTSKETTNGVVTNQLQKAFVFSGGYVADGGTGTAFDPVAPAVLNVLTPQLPVGSTTSTDAFSRSIVGGLDFLGSTALDMVIAYPQAQRISIYASPLTVSAGGQADETIMAPSQQLFGYVTAGGDVNGDARPDLLAGGTQARAWLLWQRTGATAFDNLIGDVPNFWSSELADSTVGSKFGRMTALGDVTGEGAVDVIVGDEGLCKVHIWK